MKCHPHPSDPLDLGFLEVLPALQVPDPLAVPLDLYPPALRLAPGLLEIPDRLSDLPDRLDILPLSPRCHFGARPRKHSPLQSTSELVKEFPMQGDGDSSVWNTVRCNVGYFKWDRRVCHLSPLKVNLSFHLVYHEQENPPQARKPTKGYLEEVTLQFHPNGHCSHPTTERHQQHTGYGNR